MSLLKFLGLDALLLAFGGGLYMRAFEPVWVEVSEVSLTLPRLPGSFAGIRIVQLSDLHFGGWLTTEYLEEVIQMVIDQSPDMVAITGDFVAGRGRDDYVLSKLDEYAAALKTLSRRFPVFGVLGNHDYWLNRGAVVNMLERAEIIALHNAVHSLNRDGAQLHIAGVDDVMLRRARLEEVEAALPEDGCAILLAHEPDFADVSAETGRFDLQLSGHSHGGQVVLPFIGPPMLPYLGHKYPSGLYQVRDMFQYTNRGIGMASPYVRFNCRPEITVFTLESAE